MIETIPVLLKLSASHGRFNEVVCMISASLRKNKLSSQFSPVEFKKVVLDEQDLADIYPNLPVMILNAQIVLFAHKELGLWIVKGNKAIDIVTKYKGSNNDPTKCSPNTWRFQIAKMLGSRTMTLQGIEDQTNIIVFDNFIHAPKRHEIKKEIKVFQKFF
jgi:nucleoside diphosphate kinase